LIPLVLALEVAAPLLPQDAQPRCGAFQRRESGRAPELKDTWKGAKVTSTDAALATATAIAGTAQNPVGIAPFPGTFSDPPTQAEIQAFAAKGNAEQMTRSRGKV
jgi:hypothetical protein